MGWLFTDECVKGESRLSIVRRRIESETEKFSWKAVYASQNGSVCYLAVRRTNKETGESIIYGLVVLTAIRSDDTYNFGMKEMSEDCGPNYYCAPKKLIAMLSPTDNKYALEWRKQCLENIRRTTCRKKDAEILRNLPQDTVIRVKDPHGTLVSPYMQSGRRRYKIIGRWARLSTYYILNYGYEIVESHE